MFWIAVDWAIYPQWFFRILWPRLGLMELGALFAGVLFLLRYPRAAWALCLATTQVGTALVVASANGAGDPYVSGLIFILFASPFLVPIHPTWHILSQSLALVAFGAGCWFFHPDQSVVLLQQLFILGWVSFISISSLILFLRSKDAELLALAQLEYANEALVDARLEAEEMSRAKSSFLANMSHELRTPLNAVIGYAELLREDALDEQPNWVADLDRIRDAGTYLLRLVNDVLDLSKAAAGKLEVRPQRLDLAPLVEALVPMATALATRNNNSFHTSLEPAVVYADPIRTRQILLNLISNAAKFTQNGQIRVVITTYEGGERVAVHDSGQGMDDIQLAALFSPFVQVHNENHGVLGGTGLGLAISRDLARAMKGELTVTSEEGVGSVFTLTLPALDEEDLSQQTA